jgi:acyl carrier protein
VNADQARDTVAAILGKIAPEADLDDVEPDEDLRSGLDLDSLDFLALVEGLKERTGVDVPEEDYPQVRCLAGLVTYLTAHT